MAANAIQQMVAAMCPEKKPDSVPPSNTPAVTANIVMAYIAITAAVPHMMPATSRSNSARLTHDHVIVAAPATTNRLEINVATAVDVLSSVALARLLGGA